MSPEPVSPSSIRIHFLTALAIIATVGMWGNLVYYSWFAEPLEWKYPDNTFQCVQVSRFSDFYNMVELNQGLDPFNTAQRPAPPPPKLVAAAYPPLAELLYHLFSKFEINYAEAGTGGVRKAHDFAIWLHLGVPYVLFPLMVVGWLRTNLPWLTGFLVLAAFNLSYPMQFTIDRGNLELWVLPLMTLFAWLQGSPVRWRRGAAAVALGAAISLKIYPLIFAFVYLKQERWRSFAGTLAAAAALTIPSYAVLDGGLFENVVAHYRVLQEIANMVSTHIIWATHYSSSLFSLVYLSLRFVFGLESAAAWFMAHHAGLLHGFVAAALAMLLVRRLTFARLFLGVCCVAVLGTPESPDYKLLLLFPAAIAVIAEGGGGRVFNLLFVAFLGLLLVPKHWVMFFTQVSHSSVANPLLVLGLFVLAVAAPLPAGVETFGRPAVKAWAGRLRSTAPSARKR